MLLQLMQWRVSDWEEVTGDYITLTPFLPQQLFYCVMNLEKWNSLPPDLQQTIIDVTEEFYPGSIPGVWDQENAGAVKRLAKKPIECIKLSEEETARWLDKTQYLQDRARRATGKQGLPGKNF